MMDTDKAKWITPLLAMVVVAATAASVMWARSIQAQGVAPTVQSPKPPRTQLLSSVQMSSKQPQTSTKNSAQSDSPFKNPIPEEVVKKLSAQSALSQAAEKEARRLLKADRFSEAEAASHRSLELSVKINGQPSNMSALQLLGDIYLQQKRYQDAIDTYAKAREHTRNLELDLSTALAYVRLGDLEKAKRFYSQEKFYAQAPEELRKKTLAQLPTGNDAKSFEASIFYTLGGEKSSYVAEEEAAEAYQKALNLFPRNGLFAYRLARSLMWLKRYDEALPMFARAVRFGTGEDAKDAEYRMGGFTAAKREAAMRAAAKIP